MGLPARAVVEFEVSWKTAPDFVLALGVDPDEKKPALPPPGQAQQEPAKPPPTSLTRAFRFEVWDGKLVADRETQSEADVAAIQTIAPGPGRAQVQAYLDQEAGRMIVVSPGGETLADLKVSEAKGNKAFPSIVLQNLHGDVRLERLRIRKWSGETLKPAKADQSRIHLADGTIAYGRVERYDPEAKAFVVKGDDGEANVEAAKVATVFLSPPTAEPTQPARAVFAPRAVRAVAQDGSRLSGDLVRVEGGAVELSVPGIEGTPRLPTKTLRSLIVSHLDADEPKPKPDAEPSDPKAGPVGTLELDGVKLKGHLVDGKATPGASCLTWQAEGAANASPPPPPPPPIAPGVSGKIVYHEPKPPVAAQPGNRPIVRVRPAAPPGFVQGVFGALTDQGNHATGPVSGRRALHLRTGDVIPSEFVKIDEAGITFKTSLSDSTFVSHEKVKAIELAPAPPPTVRLTRTKRDRLLTLPRMQKDSPPTQMIRAKNGDYLRGRILEMDDKTLKVEVRLETKQVPRDRVAKIIWLHEDEIDRPDDEKDKDKPKAEAVASAPSGLRVQAVRSDGIRLTFAPDAMEGATLSGRSDVLGACKVQLDEVDALLIGPEIEKAASQLAYGVWKLHDAVEPLVAQDGEGGERQPGTESPLVGKPAPDFTLDLLDGEKFHLADAKGTVVILDFWATWCGPCLQAMPQVEAVAEEFKARGVKLVAVNLEEGPKTIQSMMERHKLKMTVALDRDGAAAMKYQANAIPQTVIIDKEGNVARLYVGGGPKLGDSLREALEEVITGKKPEAPADPGAPGVIKD